ncbi:MAG: hypothetical protein R3C46_07195 [Hyphomonadaceae bacterium]
MNDVFAAIEQSPFSIWMREDFYAYFIALIFHSIGMALLIGGGVVISLRVMGLASQARLERFAGFFPAMWAGAGLAVVSGLALLAAYPAKALTNPVFGFKFASLIAASLIVRWMARRFFPMEAAGEPLPPWSRWLGALTLVLWLGGVVFGKLLLHTATVLMVS